MTAKKKTAEKKATGKTVSKAAEKTPAPAKTASPARPAVTSKTTGPNKSAAPAKRTAATAASILGRPLTKQGPVLPIKIKPEWQKYYNILMDLRDRLQQQMSGLAKDSAEQLPGYSLHMADTGTDNFDRDFALSLLSSDQDAIYEIEEALKRIERGTYGVCELTGKTIPKARLDAIPWARFTVEAQIQLEREGQLRQRRLGALGTVDNVGGVEVEETEAEEEERPIKERE